jgi:hypothetical protein
MEQSKKEKGFPCVWAHVLVGSSWGSGTPWGPMPLGGPPPKRTHMYKNLPCNKQPQWQFHNVVMATTIIFLAKKWF